VRVDAMVDMEGSGGSGGRGALFAMGSGLTDSEETVEDAVDSFSDGEEDDDED
jgi:hypothetical protein